MHRRDRTAASVKTKIGGVCLFVKTADATSNVKKVSRFGSSELERLRIPTDNSIYQDLYFS